MIIYDGLLDLDIRMVEKVRKLGRERVKNPGIRAKKSVQSSLENS